MKNTHPAPPPNSRCVVYRNKAMNHFVRRVLTRFRVDMNVRGITVRLNYFQVQMAFVAAPFST